MTLRVSTLLEGRRERLERLLGRRLEAPEMGARTALSERARAFLKEEAQDLYWNELEWENITDEEALEGSPLTELAFPGFLAFVRGLLLTEVMPDSQAPAAPRPQVVRDILDFLAERVVDLQEEVDHPDADEAAGTTLAMTSRLVDLVLYQYHQLSREEIEVVEADRRATS
jgi:hypothetical protein